MMRMMMALALVTALVGCEDKSKETPATTTTVAPTPTPTTAVAPTVTGAAAAPSGATGAPSGAAVAPSGAEIKASPSGEPAKSEHAKGDKSTRPGATTKVPPAPAGAMPHGNPEDGTLRYNPPPAQSPPAKSPPAKKGTTL